MGSGLVISVGWFLPGWGPSKNVFGTIYKMARTIYKIAGTIYKTTGTIYKIASNFVAHWD